MTKEPSAGERIADLVGGGKFETVTGLAHAIDAAIRDSNAEMVECLERSQKELERLLKCKWGNTFCFADCQTWKMNKEALARHNADKGEV